MFLYSWLHISGYGISAEDLANFRKKGSNTPGHPEYGETEGVETTTGPLGQGIGNAVGMAISEKMAEARFNTPSQKIFSHKIWCLAGDGCMQEGISAEAAAIAGVMKLGNLVLMYDSNDVTLDADASKTMSEDTAMRFESYGWEVSKCDGHDIPAVRKTLLAARDSASDKPQARNFQDGDSQRHTGSGKLGKRPRRGRRKICGRGQEKPRAAGGKIPRVGANPRVL